MFHKNLRRLMNERGMSQKQLAAITGVSVSGISQYVHGLVRPREDVMRKLAAALNVRIEFLAYGKSSGPEVDSDGLVRIKKLTPRHIAKISGHTSAQGIRLALQKGKAAYGYALQISSDKYVYHIYPKKVEECFGSLTRYGYFLEGYHREPAESGVT